MRSEAGKLIWLNKKQVRRHENPTTKYINEQKRKDISSEEMSRENFNSSHYSYQWFWHINKANVFFIVLTH